MTTKKERKLNRWQGYDYSLPGLYFVTICTKNRIECLGEIKNNKVDLNEIGEIVKKRWLWLPSNFNYVKLDTWIIMPNHIHGIIKTTYDEDYFGLNSVRNGRDRSLHIKPLYDIIGAFKTTSSKLIRQHQNNLHFTWHKSFHDRVIRNEKELNNIREYITNNPINWEFDRNNPENIK